MKTKSALMLRNRNIHGISVTHNVDRVLVIFDTEITSKISDRRKQ